MLLDKSEAPARFVHGFEAEDWLACLNMANSGRLFNFDLLDNLELFRPGVRTIGIDDLSEGFIGDGNSLTKTMITLRLAAAVRKGHQIGEGNPPYPFREASSDYSAHIVKKADIELRMEASRRRVAPKAPSRISCLYLAEATPAGRNMVGDIKGADAFTMEVKVVSALRLGRADPRWLDGVVDDDAMAGYWSGEPKDGDPPWEFLLEGIIESTNSEELERLRKWAPEAGIRAHGTQGPIGTPNMPRRPRPQKPPR